MQQRAPDVCPVLHAPAGGRAAAGRGLHVPQLPRGDQQDLRLPEPGCGEDRLRAAQRVQVLRLCVPEALAAAPRREEV